LLAAAFALLLPVADAHADATVQYVAVASEVRDLRQEIEGQRAKIEELTRLLQAQAAMIERQSEAVARLEQSVASPPQPTTASVTSPATPPATPPAATARLAASPIEGLGKIRFNGLLQGWYFGGDHGTRDSFRIRRAELRFSGDLSPRARWTVMIDPAKTLAITDGAINQAGRPLQDAYITVDRSKLLQLSVGQMKIPFSLEGLQPSGALDTVERALFMNDRARGGNYSDIRDIGAMIRGTTGGAEVQFGVFNGSGESQNDVDRNEGKSAIARATFRPPSVPGLHLGIAGVWANGRTADRPRRERAGAEMQFVRNGWKLKSEFAVGRDGDLERLGYYVHAGRQLTPRLELIARVDTFDPDTDRDNTPASTQERDYIAGFNYNIINTNLRLQANLLRKTFATDATPDRNLLLINLQTSW
jgi:phosphate-selective porin